MSSKSSTRNKQKRRPGDPWVSNNRVLNNQSMSKKNVVYGRNPNFDTDETKLLIQLWGDPKVQRTLITTHKKHAVICQLASKMEDYGYYRSPEEITTRIKNLKCFYNRLKKDLDSGQAAEPSWKHFAEMDAIMTRPIFSVRPNEVPAPSLKYQIEKEREERAAHRKQSDADGGAEDGVTESESDDYADILGGTCISGLDPNDDGIIPDVEVDIDINNKALVALAAAAAEQTQTPPPAMEGNATKQPPACKKRKLSKCSDDNSLMSDYEGEPEQGNGSQQDDDPDDLIIKEEKIDTIDVEAEDELKQLKNAANGQANDNGKDENKAGADTSGAFVIPKDEPIDVDDDSMDVNALTNSLTSNVQSMMPTLADILQMSKNNLAISSASGMLPIANLSTQMINVSAASLCSTTTTNTNASIVTTAQPGKISLVPTNFLMQPKVNTSGANNITQSSIILPSTAGQLQPPRLVLSGDASAALQCAANTGIVATGPNGMKVLLVNAEQAAAAGIRGGIPVQTLNTTNSANILQPQTQQHKQQSLKQQKLSKQQQLQQQQQQKERDDRQRIALQKQQTQRKLREERERTRREELSKKDATGMRILMRQILNAQTESNEIAHQRLALERERLEFEKSTVERLFTALPTYFTQQQQQMQLILQQQQQQQNFLQQQQQKQQQQQTSQPHYITTHTPGGQLRLSNPPKLLFTTMPASMSAKSATILNSTNTLTTSLPKTNTITTTKPVEICTQINELQLITPKLESTEE